MTTTDDPDVFEERWHGYIEELHKVRWSAETQRQSDRIDEIAQEMRYVVSEIADDWREQA